MNNVAYLDYGWFSGDVPLTTGQIDNIIQRMDFFDVKTHFCDIGVFDDSAALPAVGYSALGAWIIAAHSLGHKVVPVLNYGRRKKFTSFGDTTFNCALDATIQKLLGQFDVDGIHLDIEGFFDNDDVYLGTLKYLKTNSMAGMPLSIATPDFWSTAFIEKVAAVVDQVNPMIYDTALADANTYYTHYKDVISAYGRACNPLNCELVPIFPVYEKRVSDVVYHEPLVESLRMAVAATNSAIQSGIKVHGAGIFYMPHFLGLNPTMYKQYPTDQRHWQTYWLGHSY